MRALSAWIVTVWDSQNRCMFKATDMFSIVVLSKYPQIEMMFRHHAVCKKPIRCCYLPNMILNDCAHTGRKMKWVCESKLYFNIFYRSGACIMQGCSESFSGSLLVAMVLLGDSGPQCFYTCFITLQIKIMNQIIRNVEKSFSWMILHLKG